MSRVAWLSLALVAGGLCTSSANAQDFEKDVWPILEARCIECHRAAFRDERGRLRRPKAELRLDGQYWIAKGSEDGPVIAAGKPRQSPLYQRIALPADDADIMPPKGDPLSATQIATLKDWIEKGADFGKWQGSPGPKGAGVPSTAKPSMTMLNLQRLSQGLKPVTKLQIRKAAGELGIIREMYPGSPLLSVQFIASEPKVTDAVVKALIPIAKNVTELNLAKTQITDKALEVVARMSRLTKLKLHHTGVTDRGLAQLANLSELRSLNLYATDVSDRGLKSLANLSKLNALYLWQTKVTGEGAARLAAVLSEARVHHKPVLPETRVEPQPNRRRRR